MFQGTIITEQREKKATEISKINKQQSLRLYSSEKHEEEETSPKETGEQQEKSSSGGGEEAAIATR